MTIHQDQTKPSYEELLAQVAALKAERNGPALAWAKGKEGEALTITWPGKRGRYLEVEELEYIIENGEQVLRRVVGMMK